jgi:hypothetical protein
MPQIYKGGNTLVANIQDTADFLKVDNHNTIHGYSASWQVSNSASNPVLTRISGGASWEDQDTRVNIKATLTSGINVLSGNYTDVIYTGETYDLDDLEYPYGHL